MTTFRFDLGDGLPMIELDLDAPHDQRLLAFLQQRMSLALRVLALEAALAETIEQVEGWVAWKCPKKHLAEHHAFIARQRALLPPPPVKPH